ncbi:MAG: AMP-binding protein [Planctomycetes bacterium]|nr:AMP-binding protein [Planctomycetota bacterium]
MRRVSYCHVGGLTPLVGVPIHDFLEDVARRFPDRDALVSIPQGIRLSYAAFFREAARLAKGLMALGIARGDRVGIWATDNVEWVLLQVATAQVGAVLVNINPANKAPELEHALRAARVQALFLMPEFKASRYAEVVMALPRERVPELRQLVIFDPSGPARRPSPAFLTWQEVMGRGEAEVTDGTLAERAATLEADDPINIQFTSGTTGAPKPVVLTHMNILNNGWFAGEVLGFTERDRLCVPVPFYHCFGMVVSNLACLTRGAAIVIPAPHFEAGATLLAIERERCTAVHGVPTMFVAELERPDFRKFDLSSLRTGIMAGAPCARELVRRVIAEMGCRELLIGYGQTEASPITHLTRPTDPFERRVGTVGTNLPHQEVKVVDPGTGRLLPVGEQGEVCFRGYHVMRGYFGMEEATRRTIDAAGWLRSGDLGVMDADGYLRITGRLKDMIVRGGEKIYPAEIEAWLGRHPAVAQCAVFGVGDPKWGEEVGAWVQPHEGASLTAEEVLAHARQGLAHYKIPRYLRIVREFPLTVTGKIRKFRIREIVEAELRGGAAR